MLKFRLKYSRAKGSRLLDSFRAVRSEYNYCESHRFWYNSEHHTLALYQGRPCIHTDVRYVDGDNFSREGGFWAKNGSLKSCIRKLRKTYNLPVGTTVNFENKYTGHDVTATITQENNKDFDFQINAPAFERWFSTDAKANDLIKKMREVGFIVAVWPNTGFLAGGDCGEEIAICHGFNKVVGMSSHNNTFRGYSAGVDSILYDFYGEFDKWSRCCEISKAKTNGEILEILMAAKNKNDLR